MTQKETEYRQKQEAEQLRQRRENEKLKREQEKLEHQRNLQRYEQEFRRAIEAEYPLNDYVRNGLKDFQQSLGLKSEDIEQLERPILTQKEAEYRQKLEAEQLREEERLKREKERLEYQHNQEDEDQIRKFKHERVIPSNSYTKLNQESSQSKPRQQINPWIFLGLAIASFVVATATYGNPSTRIVAELCIYLGIFFVFCWLIASFLYLINLKRR
ncbi:hypothetical protein [Calothrix sp. PCC 7507]|uniref:hypothetical protein n=1 Tax=Calothrix sp. PCC 7507 TaxID=99598 RepID=UPI0003145387|nr:hypothetical protein [Calothrix sp. PCC 7507]